MCRLYILWCKHNIWVENYFLHPLWRYHDLKVLHWIVHVHLHVYIHMIGTCTQGTYMYAHLLLVAVGDLYILSRDHEGICRPEPCLVYWQPWHQPRVAVCRDGCHATSCPLHLDWPETSHIVERSARCGCKWRHHKRPCYSIVHLCQGQQMALSATCKHPHKHYTHTYTYMYIYTRITCINIAAHMYTH